jgi:hypothetical protein
MPFDVDFNLIFILCQLCLSSWSKKIILNGQPLPGIISTKPAPNDRVEQFFGNREKITNFREESPFLLTPGMSTFVLLISKPSTTAK